MSSVGRRRLTGLLAVAGVVLAHTVDYALVHPDPAARAHHLLASGHGYWPLALVAAGLSGLLAASAAVVVGAARGASGRRWSRRDGLVRRLLGLVGLQLVLFTGLETVEHLVSGAAPAELVGAPEFLLGLPLQVLAAVFMVAVLALLEVLAERVASRFAGPRFPRERHQARPGRRVRGSTPLAVVRPRAPPQVALS